MLKSYEMCVKRFSIYLIGIGFLGMYILVFMLLIYFNLATRINASARIQRDIFISLVYFDDAI